LICLTKYINDWRGKRKGKFRRSAVEQEELIQALEAILSELRQSES